jgi:2-iminobutanoate/2-iminopropanoate deaminase
MENMKPDPVSSVSALPLSVARRAHGSLLFLSGRLALKDGVVVGATIGEQTDVIMRQVQAILANDNLRLSDIVKCTVWLSSVEDFAAFNAAYAAWFELEFPVRSTVVSQLLIPGALVEIECVADIKS